MQSNGSTSIVPFDQEGFIPGSSEGIGLGAPKVKKNLLELKLEEVDDLYAYSNEALAFVPYWAFWGVFAFLILLVLSFLVLRNEVHEGRRRRKKSKAKPDDGRRRRHYPRKQRQKKFRFKNREQESTNSTLETPLSWTSESTFHK